VPRNIFEGSNVSTIYKRFTHIFEYGINDSEKFVSYFSISLTRKRTAKWYSDGMISNGLGIDMIRNK